MSNYVVGQLVRAVSNIVGSLDNEGEHTETLALEGHPLIVREILHDEFFDVLLSWDHDCLTTFGAHFSEIAPA